MLLHFLLVGVLRLDLDHEALCDLALFVSVLFDDFHSLLVLISLPRQLTLMFFLDLGQVVCLLLLMLAQTLLVPLLELLHLILKVGADLIMSALGLT